MVSRTKVSRGLSYKGKVPFWIIRFSFRKDTTLAAGFYSNNISYKGKTLTSLFFSLFSFSLGALLPPRRLSRRTSRLPLRRRGIVFSSSGFCQTRARADANALPLKTLNIKNLKVSFVKTSTPSREDKARGTPSPERAATTRDPCSSIGERKRKKKRAPVLLLVCVRVISLRVLCDTTRQ